MVGENRWSVIAGRGICFDGQLVVSLLRGPECDPTTADGLAHHLAALLNADGSGPTAIHARHLEGAQ